MTRFLRSPTLAVATLAAAASLTAPARAADFYQGKQITIVVGFTTGGTYDATARLWSRYLGKHLAGNPSVIVRNMPGSGSLVATNHLYNAAPRDGTELAVIGGGTVLEPLLGNQQAKYDGRRFNWIGGRSPDDFVCAVWHTVPVQTMQDVTKRETVVGSTGPGSRTLSYPKALNELLGTKFKIVTGYPGGNEITLALERGEVEGYCGWAVGSIKQRAPQWLKDGTVRRAGTVHPLEAGTAECAAGERPAADQDRQAGDRAAGRRFPAGLAAAGAARPAGGTGARVAHGLQCHDEGSRLAGRGSETRSRNRTSPRRGDAEPGGTPLHDAAGRGRAGQAHRQRPLTALVVALPSRRGAKNACDLRHPATPRKRPSQKEVFMSDFVVETADGVLRVTINHPERGNAMSDDMAVELTRIIEGAAKTASVMVLRGAGDDFCIGRARGPGGPPPMNDALERRDVSDTIFNCYGAFRRASIPIVGAVKGRALGFGCALAALCDITIAAENAQFQAPEYAHNIMPTMVMSALVDRVSRKTMNYLIYSTEMLDAQRALIGGLVSQVVPEAKLDEAVEKLCRNIVKAPRSATEAVKEYSNAAPDMSVPGAVEYARNLHATINSAIEARTKR